MPKNSLLNENDMRKIDDFKELLCELIKEYIQRRDNIKDYYNYIKNEESLRDIELLLFKLNRYIEQEQYGKVQIILKHYNPIIEAWEYRFSEELKKFIEEYKQAHFKRRAKIQEKRNKKINESGNYHTEERIELLGKELFIKKYFGDNPCIFKQVGYNKMIDGLKVAVSIYEPEKEIVLSESEKEKLVTTANTIKSMIFDAFINENDRIKTTFTESGLWKYTDEKIMELYPEVDQSFCEMKNLMKKEDYIKEVQNAINKSKKFANSLLAFYLVLNTNDMGTYTGVDIQVCGELMNEENLKVEKKYLLSMCMELSMMYQDYSLIVNWLSLQIRPLDLQNVECKKIKKESLLTCLEEALLKILFSPIVLEASCYEMLRYSKLLGEKSRYYTGRKIIERLGINFENNTELFSKEFSYPCIIKYAKDLRENELESYICATGYNICVMLVSELDKVCLFKDQFREYNNELEKLMEQVARYMYVFGSRTEVLLRYLLEIIKKYNDDENLWSFMRSKPEVGKEFLNIITRVMKGVDVENTIAYLQFRCSTSLFDDLEKSVERYWYPKNHVQSLMPVLYKKHKCKKCQFGKNVLVELITSNENAGSTKKVKDFIPKEYKEIYKANCEEKDAETRYQCLNMSASIILKRSRRCMEEIGEAIFKEIEITSNKYGNVELQNRIDDLRRQVGWNKLLICEACAVQNDTLYDIGCFQRNTDRPSKNKGRWYCVLQKMLLNKLN